MTHVESVLRRRAVAAFVDMGGTAQEAAREFVVSESFVYSSCREYGVQVLARQEKVGAKTFKVLAELQNTEKSCAQIAKENCMTRQSVCVKLKAAKIAGMKFPSHR